MELGLLISWLQNKKVILDYHSLPNAITGFFRKESRRDQSQRVICWCYIARFEYGEWSHEQGKWAASHLVKAIKTPRFSPKASRTRWSSADTLILAYWDPCLTSDLQTVSYVYHLKPLNLWYWYSDHLGDSFRCYHLVLYASHHLAFSFNYH